MQGNGNRKNSGTLAWGFRLAMFAAAAVLLAACAQVRLPAAAPTIVSFDASPLALTAGESSTLSWEVEGADSVVLQPLDDAVDATGTRAVSPDSTTTYTLVATNGRGTAEAEVTISVRQPDDPPLVARFMASPDEIDPGGQSVLVWDVAGADTIVVTPGIGVVAEAAGSRIVQPTATTTYTLVATNAHGSASENATVTVTTGGADGTPIIASFTADPEGIELGESSTLAWSVSGADTITVSPGVGNVPAEGSADVTPATTTTYTLRATNSAGTSTRSVTVHVREDPNSPPLIARFTASPAHIAPGAASTLSWVVVGADSVTIDNGIGIVPPNSSTSVAPDATTSYTLTASNANGSSQASVTVQVSSGPEPQDPVVAAFLADPASGTAPFTTAFHWVVIDPDGMVDELTISFGDGSAKLVTGDLQGSADHTYANAGAYKALLTVRLIDGTTIERSTVVPVSGPPGTGNPPVIDDFSANPAEGTVPLTVQLGWDASGETSLICTIDFGDGSATDTIVDCATGSVSHVYTVPGVYLPSIAVQDANGNVANAVVTVTAHPPAGDDGPVITSFTGTPDSGDMPLDVAFGWTTQSPASLSVSTWLYLGDGSLPVSGGGNGTREHTYTAAGRYHAVLLAIDSAGGYDLDVVTITVIDPTTIPTAIVRTGSTLVELDASDRSLLAPLLGSLLDLGLDLSILSNQALLDTDFGLLGLLEVLALNVGADGPEAILLGTVDLVDIIESLLELVSGTAAALPLQDLLDLLPALPLPIALGDLFDIDLDDLASLDGIDLRVLDMLVLVLELFNAQNVTGTPEPVEIGLGSAGGLLDLLGLTGLVEGTLGGDALARIHLQVVEPPVLTVARTDRLGEEFAGFRSAGIRLAVELTGLNLSIDTLAGDSGTGGGLLDGLLGVIGGLLDGLQLLEIELDLTLVELSLFAEIGSFEGYVSAIDVDTGAVTVHGLGGLAHAHLGSIDHALFFDRGRTTPVVADFSRIASVELDVEAELIIIPLGRLNAQIDVLARANTDRNAAASSATIHGPFPASATLPSVGVGTLVSDLLGNLELDLAVDLQLDQILGGVLPLDVLDSLLGLVEGLLDTVLGIAGGGLGASLPLDGLLEGLLGSTALELLGAHFNRNEVTVLQLLIP